MEELKEVVEAAAPKKRATKTAKAETEKKAPAKKAAATEKKAAAEKKAPAAKKAPAKKAAAVEEKAPVEKKAPVKRTKKAAEPETTVTIQFAGKEIVTKDILEKVKAAYAEANKDEAIKTIEVYVKPEENAAYYVVNGVGSDDYKVQL